MLAQSEAKCVRARCWQATWQEAPRKILPLASPVASGSRHSSSSPSLCHHMTASTVPLLPPLAVLNLPFHWMLVIRFKTHPGNAA